MERLLACAGMLVVVAFGYDASAHEPISVEISTDKAEYVVREPIRFRVHIVNRSDDAVSIVPAHWLHKWPGFVGLSVAASDGRIHEVKGGYLGHSSRSTPGDTLLPRARVEVILHPGVLAPTQTSPRDRDSFHGFASEEPGAYAVRAWYSVSDYYDSLWTGTVYSKKIEVKVRNATPAERDVLDAYWTGTRAYGRATGIDADIEKLRAAVQAHPDCELVVHAKLQLARALGSLWQTDLASVAEAVAVLQDLREEHVDFDMEDVYWLSGVAYLILGEFDKASDVLRTGISHNAMLYTDFNYMSRVVAASLGKIHADEEWRAWRPRVIAKDVTECYEKALDRPH